MRYGRFSPAVRDDIAQARLAELVEGPHATPVHWASLMYMRNRNARQHEARSFLYTWHGRYYRQYDEDSGAIPL